jgi:hypothetical protein
MTIKPAKRVRCAVYTRVSTEYGLDQEFTSERIRDKIGASMLYMLKAVPNGRTDEVVELAKANLLR